MYKKIILLLLSVFLLISLCGCGKKDEASSVINEMESEQHSDTEGDISSDVINSENGNDNSNENDESEETNEDSTGEATEAVVLEGAGIYYLSGMGYDGEGALGMDTLALFDYTLDNTYLFLLEDGTGEMGIEDSDGGCDIRSISWSNQYISADGMAVSFERRGNDIVLFPQDGVFMIFTLKDAECTIDPIAFFDEVGFTWNTEFKELLDLISGDYEIEIS